MVLIGISCACKARVIHGEARVIKAAVILQKAWRAHMGLEGTGGMEDDLDERREE